MFRWYGFVGAILIAFSEFVIFLKIEPFLVWFTPMVWTGYILLIDSIVFSLKGESMLMNHRHKFLNLLLMSIVFWYVFEIINKTISFGGWVYVNLPANIIVTYIMGTLAFATIVPAVFETWDLIKQLHLFQRLKPKISFHPTKITAILLLVLGIVFIGTPFVVSSPWIWALVFLGFIFLLDPIMYLHKDEKSILFQIKKKRFNTLISLFLAGYVAGFLWEFWNFWAYSKWYYTIPILESIKVFEIPLVGFLAYGPFAIELYVMYHFVRMIFSSKRLHQKFGKLI